MKEQDKNDLNRIKMESELIRRTLKGDNEAFAELIKGYYRMYYSIAYGYIRNHTEVEDIVQEGVIEIHKELGSLQNPWKFGSWSYTIVKRICMHTLRKKSMETKAIAEFEEHIHQEKQFLNPQQLDSSVHHVILDTIMQLPMKLQEVTLLYYLEKLNHQDISQKLQISTRAVEMRLHRARKILRHRIRRNT